MKKLSNETEEEAEDTVFDTDLRYVNLKYPNQTQKFNFSERLTSVQFQACAK